MIVHILEILLRIAYEVSRVFFYTIKSVHNNLFNINLQRYLLLLLKIITTYVWTTFFLIRIVSNHLQA